MFDRIFFKDEYQTTSALEINMRVRAREKKLALLAVEEKALKSQSNEKNNDSSKGLVETSVQGERMFHRELLTERK